MAHLSKKQKEKKHEIFEALKRKKGLSEDSMYAISTSQAKKTVKKSRKKHKNMREENRSSRSRPRPKSK